MHSYLHIERGSETQESGSELGVMLLLTFLLNTRLKIPDVSNEEKRKDLGIGYGRHIVLPRCFMKSIHQYQSRDKVQQKN